MSARMRLLAYPIVILLGILAVAGGVPGQSGVQYFYDGLGRLVGVIDTSGNAAAYSYDAVGNLTSIANYTASQASVLQFTPTSGPVGTTVTISGTGFSTTLSSDSVSFNGTSATVSSATVNQIVTTVPSGATTGTISVTTPAGTFTTTSNFTVTNSTGVPTISSFTPTVATPGTSITITGTNFATTTAYDQLRFNISRQVASSATSTTISTTTPVGTSGHIQVSTPSGTGVSSQDLYVPFGTHTASQVGYSQRTSLGTAATISLGTAGQIGLLIFDANAGQRVSLSISGATFPTCINVYLFAPDGSPAIQSSCPSATAFIGVFTAPYTGTYTVGIDPLGGSNTGSVSVTPNDATDISQTISIGGSPVTSTTTTPGQRIVLSFSTSSGQKISLIAANSTFTSQANFGIFNPDGTPVTSGYANAYTTGYIGATTLGQTGTYKIYITPNTPGDTGQLITHLYDATPSVGTTTATSTGSAFAEATTSPGQSALYTFSGTAGERVSLTIQHASFSSSWFYSPGASVSVSEPSGGTVASASVGAYYSYTYFIDASTLPNSGTYTIDVAPGPYTGTADITLYQVPADASGTVSIGGSAVTSTTTTPGQNAQLTFSGTSGGSVSLTCSSVTYSYTTPITLYNPDGSVLATGYAYPYGNTIFSGTSLGQTGTYKIYIDPAQADVGQMTLQVTSP